MGWKVSGGGHEGQEVYVCREYKVTYRNQSCHCYCHCHLNEWAREITEVKVNISYQNLGSWYRYYRTCLALNLE